MGSCSSTDNSAQMEEYAKFQCARGEADRTSYLEKKWKAAVAEALAQKIASDRAKDIAAELALTREISCALDGILPPELANITKSYLKFND